MDLLVNIDVRLNFLDCPHVEQPSDDRPGANPSATFIAPAISASHLIKAS